MGFLKNLFGKKDEPINSYADFWNWFAKNENEFFEAVETRDNIEKKFFNKLQPALAQVQEDIFYLTGMLNDKTVELVLSAEGVVKKIVFVEELIKAAPAIEGWTFTALKPALDIKDLNISMSGHDFNKDNMSFYAVEEADYPDEINITIVHNDINEDNKNEIINGIYIFLDNYLGELNFATTIDNLDFKPIEQAEKELIPIEKLKQYLTWRQKEFIEKYEGTRHNTENDNYSGLEAELKNGRHLVAVINSDLLEWDSKASHPWVMVVEIKYDGEATNGMPGQETFDLLNQIEDELTEELKDFEGYLNIGRQTADNLREIYFACKDFRKPSKLAYEIQTRYAGKADFSYDIYMDKYWRTFNRFMNK